MYGTVFNLNVKEGHKDKLIEVMGANDRTPDGMVAWFLMNPDDDTDWNKLDRDRLRRNLDFTGKMKNFDVLFGIGWLFFFTVS